MSDYEVRRGNSGTFEFYSARFNVRIATFSKGVTDGERMDIGKRLGPPAPIPMVLHCPMCLVQHVDEPSATWDNPPHRSHQCQNCGHIWRPADVATTGVPAIETKGQVDSPPVDSAFKMPAWTVGQRVVISRKPQYRRRDNTVFFREGKIEKIGRKWVTVALDGSSYAEQFNMLGVGKDAECHIWASQ